MHGPVRKWVTLTTPLTVIRGVVAYLPVTSGTAPRPWPSRSIVESYSESQPMALSTVSSWTMQPMSPAGVWRV